MIRKNILDTLDMEERKIAIEFIPKHIVVDYIKKNRKRIPEVNGLRLDVKSQTLLQKIPSILLKRVDQSDKLTIAFINTVLEEKIAEVYGDIDEKMGEVEFVQGVFKNEEQEKYLQVLQFLMEKLELTNILVFLKLSEIELQENQQEMLKQNIDMLKLKKEIRDRIYDELNTSLEIKYKEEINTIEEKHRNIIKVHKDRYKETIEKVKHQEQLIYQEQEKVKELKKKCEHKDNEIDNLKKAIDSIELKCKNKTQHLNDKLNDKEEQYQIIAFKNNELEEELKKKDIYIMELQKNLEADYQEYSDKYLARWKIENQCIVNRKEQLELDIEYLEVQYNDLKKSIEEITIEKEDAIEKLDHYSKMVTNFVENIDEEIIQSALNDIMLNIKVKEQAINSQNQIRPYIKQGIKRYDIELCNDIDDLIYNIETNFSALGIKDKDSNYPDYIVSVLAARRIPLIVGYGTRNIVRAISSAYAGEMPEIISLPSGFNDVEMLNGLYYAAEAKVVLIEGVIGQLNESVILPLLRDYVEDTENEKLLFITCEDIESIRLLPAYLLEYMALVQIENIRPKVNPQYIYSDGKEALQTFRNNLTNIDEGYTKMHRLLKGINFNVGYIITRANILAYINCLREIQSSLECLLTAEIKFIGEYHHIKDQIQENIASNKKDFSNKLERVILGD